MHLASELSQASSRSSADFIRDAGDAAGADAAQLPGPTHSSTAILTHPSLSLWGTVSAPSPGTSAPSLAARRTVLQWRCQCSAPLRPCSLPLRRSTSTSSQLDQK